MPAEPAPSPKSAVRHAVVRDLLATAGLPAWPGFDRAVWTLGGSRLHRFVAQAERFDEHTAIHGLAPAANQFARALEVRLDLAAFPARLRQGPLLITANHPGLADTLALFAAINRPDLRILAEPNPFLLALPRVSERILYLSDDPSGRGGALRGVLRHLRGGGALLTFPAGRIEPDPRWFVSKAISSLADWSASLDLLARGVPGLTVLPALVGGVFHPDALRHPLTRLGRDQAAREMIAAYVQLLGGRQRGVDVRVRFGRPWSTADGSVRDWVNGEMARLIERQV